MSDAMGARPSAPIGLLDPALWARSPHALWRELRSEGGPVWDRETELWAIVNHADVLDVERRSRTFSSAGHYRAVPDPAELTMINQDDPSHAQQRKLYRGRFSPAAARAYHGLVTTIVEDLVDSFIDEPSIEVVETIASQVPARVICGVVGMDDAMWPTVKTWSERLMRLDVRDCDAEAAKDFRQANRDIRTWLEDALRSRRISPGPSPDDLLALWLEPSLDGAGLDFERVFHELGLFISGGAETTRTTLAHGLRVFCDHPAEWDLLASDPDATAGAVEEVIRWVTPINNFFRQVSEPAAVGGVDLAEGERLMLVYPSANRDDRVFERPDHFDITRDPNPHVSFGHGTHFCLGANVARVELRAILQVLAARLTHLRPVSEPAVEENIFVRAVSRFDLGFAAR